MKFVIRADAGPKFGYGHLTRSLALAEGLRSAGSSVLFLVRGPKNLLKGLSNQRFLSITIPERWTMEKELQFLIKRLRRKPAVVILDSYLIDSEYQKRLKQEHVPVIAFDDEARIHQYADLVINPNFHLLPRDYQKEPYSDLLIGGQYSPIRNQLRQRTFSKNSKGDHILVSFGGSRAGQMGGLKVLKALKNLGINKKIVFLISKSKPAFTEFRHKVKAMKLLKVRIETDTSKFASLARRSLLAITGGGVTCHELAYLGIPNLAMILASNQKGPVLALEQKGVLKCLGVANQVRPEQIRKQAGLLLNNPSLRTTLARKGRKVIDGKGVERIIPKIKGILHSS